MHRAVPASSKSGRGAPPSEAAFLCGNNPLHLNQAFSFLKVLFLFSRLCPQSSLEERERGQPPQPHSLGPERRRPPARPTPRKTCPPRGGADSVWGAGPLFWPGWHTGDDVSPWPRTPDPQTTALGSSGTGEGSRAQSCGVALTAPQPGRGGRRKSGGGERACWRN